MHSSKLLVICFITLLLQVALSSYCEVSTSTSQNQLTATSTIGQTFVSPLTGSLRGLRIFMNSSYSGIASAEFYAGTVLNSSNNFIEQMDVGTDVAEELYVYFTQASVVAGQTYTVLISLTNAINFTQGNYTKGNAIIDGVVSAADLSFEFCWSGYTVKNALFKNSTDGAVVLETLGYDQYEHMYLAGEIYGNVSLGGQEYQVPNGAVFLAKYDNQSNHVWDIILPVTLTGNWAYIWAGSVSPDGHIAVTGPFTQVQFPQGNCSSTSADEQDLFVALFYPNGTEAWHKCFGTPANDEAGISVVIGNDSFVYVAGSYWNVTSFGGDNLGENDTHSSFVAKYSLTGEHIWSVSFPTGGDTWAITKDNFVDDAVVIAFAYRNNFTINGTSLQAASSTQALVLKLSAADGSYIWHVAFGELEKDAAAKSVSIDSEGSVLVVGVVDGSCNIGPDLLFEGPGGVFLLKLSATGEPLWGNQYGGGLNYGMSVVRAGFNNQIFVIGYPDEVLNIGGPDIIQPAGYIASFSPNGEYLWQTVFNSNTSNTYVWGLHASPSFNTVIWGGSLDSNTTLDGFSYSALSDKSGAFAHLYALDEVVVPTPSASPSPSVVVSPSSSPSSSESSSSDRSGLSTGSLIGIIIAAVAVAGAIVGIIAYFVIRKRANQIDVEMN